MHAKKVLIVEDSWSPKAFRTPSSETVEVIGRLTRPILPCA
jgi:hypothetical protein